MGARYIFRLDDVCENMNWDNFVRVQEVFLRHKVKPIIGVIPNNQDASLLKLPKCSFSFWREVRRLQQEYGWSVALHGLTHAYETEDSGMLGVNSRSEFAGLCLQVQDRKIKEGVRIFRENDVRIDAFMAPAHSFDRTTLECLKSNGIRVITDGYAFYPYYEYGILFVPQLTSRPRNIPLGLWTFCLHTNSMSRQSIDDLESFVCANLKNVVSFAEATKHVISHRSYRMQSVLLKGILATTRRIKTVFANIRVDRLG